MKKTNKIAIIIISSLAVIFIAILSIFLLTNQENRSLYEDEKIRIIYGDELIGEFTLNELLELSSAVEFQAIYKPNNALPIDRTYTGIHLRELIIALNIEMEDVSNIQFSAMDGMTKIYTKQDILQDNNVYIAYLVNGEPFSSGIISSAYNHPQEDGGPFVVIRANDTISQHRVKLLVEIKINN